MGNVELKHKPLPFRIELNVLNHLGLGLYSSTPAVMTEIIANAWDADAKYVTITMSPKEKIISIEDNGHGMDEDGVKNKFLSVGYSRRTNDDSYGNFSRSGTRRVMGRKGIGKLAMFSLAEEIDVVTKERGKEAVAYRIDVEKLKKKLNSAAPNREDTYSVDAIQVPADFNLEHGTRIILSRLKKNIERTESFLRSRLARRFSLFKEDFEIKLNDKPVLRCDAGFYDDVQFLWCFDEATKAELADLVTNIATLPSAADPKVQEPCIRFLDGEIPTVGTVRGFIATVDLPKKLGTGDESLNKISVFSNKRVFQEDIFPELGDARYFNSYIIGEIHADFLDDDDTDRATTSREAVRHHDPKFKALKTHLKKRMKEIRDQWDELRRDLGYKNAPEKEAAVEKWLEAISDPRDRRLADRLMVSIANHQFSNNTLEDRNTKKQLYRSAIAAFEKLKVRRRLEDLEKITDVLSSEFQEIFSSIDSIEESHFYDITTGRLEIIETLEKHVDDKVLEKVVQKYLFDHLWLLDPSWGRVSGSATMEETLTKYLKKAYPDTKDGARLDIRYRMVAGEHVIVELKRPGKTIPYQSLYDQANKYRKAITQYYKDESKEVPPISICLLVEKRPSEMDDGDERTLLSINTKILTYNGLIVSARMAYEEYINAQNLVGSIESVLAELN